MPQTTETLCEKTYRKKSDTTYLEQDVATNCKGLIKTNVLHPHSDLRKKLCNLEVKKLTKQLQYQNDLLFKAQLAPKQQFHHRNSEIVCLVY